MQTDAAKEKIPSLAELRLFDGCLTLGRIVRSGCPQYLTRDNVLEVLNRYCISEALVHEHHARVIEPRNEGNYALLDAIRGLPQLHPAWLLEPPRKPGRQAAEALVDEMLGAGVRVARLCMKAAPPLPWLWNDLCDALQDHRVPCMLDFGRDETYGLLTDSDMAGIY